MSNQQRKCADARQEGYLRQLADERDSHARAMRQSVTRGDLQAAQMALGGMMAVEALERRLRRSQEIAERCEAEQTERVRLRKVRRSQRDSALGKDAEPAVSELLRSA
jgi:hypothetical protein